MFFSVELYCVYEKEKLFMKNAIQTRAKYHIPSTTKKKHLNYKIYITHTYTHIYMS